MEQATGFFQVLVSSLALLLSFSATLSFRNLHLDRHTAAFPFPAKLDVFTSSTGFGLLSLPPSWRKETREGKEKKEKSRLFLLAGQRKHRGSAARYDQFLYLPSPRYKVCLGKPNASGGAHKVANEQDPNRRRRPAT